MSRMLAYISPHALPLREAVGARTLGEFSALAALHRDGRGVAGLDGDGRVHRRVSLADHGEDILSMGPALRSGAAYLRFASAGSTVSPENIQPFTSEATAFCHNGALVPFDRALALLAPSELGDLTGTTDSAVYFAIVRRALAVAPRTDEEFLAAIGSAVAVVRDAFPEACLNALVVHERGLVVINSPGTRPTPTDAFTARGFSLDSLPPGHGPEYNRLWRCRRGPVSIVATSGIDVDGWEPLPVDAVSLVREDGRLLSRDLDVTRRPGTRGRR